MAYEAKYGINCGEKWMGSVTPHYEEITREIAEEKPEQALRKALCTVMHYSYDYFSDPVTGKTKVKLLELKDKDGNVLPQEILYQSLLELLMKESGLTKDQVDSSEIKLEDKCLCVETTPEQKLVANYEKKH